jgi:ribonuclease HI
MNYLDDNLWCMRNHDKAQVVAFVKFFMPLLGFLYNEKCNWVPAVEAGFLGLIINTKEFAFKVAPDKLQELLNTAQALFRQAQAGDTVQVELLQSFLGKLNAVRLAVQPVGTWTRALYGAATPAHEGQQTGTGHTGAACLNTAAREELKFWCTELPKHNGYRIRAAEHEVVLHSDASEVGYGGHALGIEVFGQLPEQLVGSSSTRRELFGLCELAERLVRVLTGKQVKVKMDSQCAVRILTKGGSTINHPELSELTKRWWRWCQENGVRASYEWCPRELNKRADDLSKVFDREWSLTTEGRKRIEAEWGKLPILTTGEVRRLATSLSAPPHERYLLVPHFNAIASTIQLCRALRLDVCIVHPRWEAQSWWPTVMALARKTLTLQNSRISLSATSIALLPNWSMCASLFLFAHS